MKSWGWGMTKKAHVAHEVLSCVIDEPFHGTRISRKKSFRGPVLAQVFWLKSGECAWGQKPSVLWKSLLNVGPLRLFFKAKKQFQDYFLRMALKNGNNLGILK